MSFAFVLAVLAQVAPVEVPLPPGFDAARPWKAVRARDGKEVPAQAAGAVAVVLDEAGEKAEYRIESGPAGAYPKVECLDPDGKHLLFRFGGKDILRYNYAVVKPPGGVDPVFERSGYIHPVWNPAGNVVSNDHPPKHLHHHGLWFPWTSSEFEGRKSDFWNSAARQGKVECVKVEESWSGPVFGGFRARHRFVNLNAPEGPKAALDEVWEVRVYARADVFLFDLVSTQTCATNSPLVIKEYRYGGLGFRGSGEWEGKKGVEFLTSEGKRREDGHATRARWCSMFGKVNGKETTVGFLCHPSNFRYPQNMRIHPDEPFFNWAPSQAGDFSIEPGKPYVSRYRFVVADGTLGKEDLERHFTAYVKK